MFLLLMPLSRPVDEDVLRENLQNLLHVPLFAVVALLLRYFQSFLPSRWQSLFVCIFAASLLAVLSELVQRVTGRTPSFGDIMADLSGILIISGILQLYSERRALMLGLILFMAGAVFFVFTVQPLVGELNSIKAKREVFPKLVDLGKPNGLWQAQGATRLQVVKNVGHTSRSGLDVQMASGSYEGLRYTFPKGVDSAGYSDLLIETVNPGQAFELGVRMDNDTAQRQYGSTVVPQGHSVLHVKWTSKIRNAELVRVVLFTGKDEPARRFQLLDVRLLRGVP